MTTKKTTTKGKRSARKTKSDSTRPKKWVNKAGANKAGSSQPKATNSKRPSALDAAAQVLAKATSSMRCSDLITAMATQGLWKSPGGKTPAATLYSAILREINVKKSDSRFKKIDRGQFAFNGKRS